MINNNKKKHGRFARNLMKAYNEFRECEAALCSSEHNKSHERKKEINSYKEQLIRQLVDKKISKDEFTEKNQEANASLLKSEEMINVYKCHLQNCYGKVVKLMGKAIQKMQLDLDLQTNKEIKKAQQKKLTRAKQIYTQKKTLTYNNIGEFIYLVGL